MYAPAKKFTALSSHLQTPLIHDVELIWFLDFLGHEQSVTLLHILRLGSTLPFQKGERAYKWETRDRSNLNGVVAIYTSSASLSVTPSGMGHATTIIVKYRRKSPANLLNNIGEKMKISEWVIFFAAAAGGNRSWTDEL